MINISVPEVETHLKPRITVVGVGGAGGNAINNMIESNLEGVRFLATNTDAQALAGSKAEQSLQLGPNITRGLGAGARPDIGRAAAEETMTDILSYIESTNMLFITAGMGGGTGTGAAPVIAQAAREQGILTVGVVTKPFHFEGAARMKSAEEGIQELQKYVDTLIIIPNQNLFRIANERTTFAEAFTLADEVLHAGVRGVTDLMVVPGLINLDFADIRTVMSEMGKAMMGTGEAEGERRAVEAAEAAISNPLLDDVSMKGARGVLINITGGSDMTLFEVDEAANRIRSEIDSNARIIFGSTFDEKMEGKMRVSIVATGIDAEDATQAQSGSDTESVTDTRPQSETVQHSITPPWKQEGILQEAPPQKATTSGENFIPPKPVTEIDTMRKAPVSETRAAVKVETETPVEQATEAVQAQDTGYLKPVQMMPSENAMDAPKKGPSLFQRMTGRADQETPPAPPQPENKIFTIPPAQARLGIEKPAATKQDEDLLDIPAFLRRQAN